MSFDLPLGASLTIDVEGTRRMLAFAELCALEGGLRRFTDISTAYVAGLHRGRFGEDDLDVGQRFRNPYEQSKVEAEIVVRESSLPITVVRPSIIVGDRHSGWTASFNVLYRPLRARGRDPRADRRGRRRGPDLSPHRVGRGLEHRRAALARGRPAWVRAPAAHLAASCA